jgi:hypothetical protein
MPLVALTLAAAWSTASTGVFASPDWTAIGIVLQIVGCFLLANGILFRNPSTMVAERLGRAPQQLRRIRAFVFHRVQMTLGFLFLVVGLAAQLYGHAQPARADEEGSPALWIGAIVVLAVVLEIGGWWWSLYALRGHVRRFLRENPPDFETDMNLAREVGELLGIETHGDDTVQLYLARLRASLGLPGGSRTGAKARSEERRAYVPPVEESDPGYDEI